jgi:cysteine desulfurase
MRTDSEAMAAKRIYLDHNASAPLKPAARAAMLAALDVDANPSSVHADGRNARRIVETARREVAGLVNGDPANVLFTSGATEAASWLLTPNWRMGRAPLTVGHLYVCAADHPATLNGGHFSTANVTRIGVDGDGLIRCDELALALAGHDKSSGVALVAVHLANNETGVIQPLTDVARIAKGAGAILVLDAVQAAGRIPLDISGGSADFLILSSHKIGGPKGAGAVVSSGGVLMPEALHVGGGQEHGHRAGTENVAAIAGFGEAALEAGAALPGMSDVRALRDRIEGIVIEAVPDAVIFGRAALRLPNTTFFAIPGIKAETAQIAFDLAGIALSAGSACSSGKVGPSHVLKAMGQDAFEGGLRVSIGRETTLDDIDRFAMALKALVARRAGSERAA